MFGMVSLFARRTVRALVRAGTPKLQTLRRLIPPATQNCPLRTITAVLRRHTNAGPSLVSPRPPRLGAESSPVTPGPRRVDTLNPTISRLLRQELVYMELDRRGAELLCQVLTEREERNSVAIASNESFSGWTKTFTDPRLCVAIRGPTHSRRQHHRDRHRLVPPGHHPCPPRRRVVVSDSGCGVRPNHPETLGASEDWTHYP